MSKGKPNREFLDNNKQRQFNNLRIILSHTSPERSIQYGCNYYMYFCRHRFSVNGKGCKVALDEFVIDAIQPIQNTVNLLDWLGFDHVYTDKQISREQLIRSIDKKRCDFPELNCKNWEYGKVLKFVNIMLLFMYDCEIIKNTQDKYIIHHNLLGVYTSFNHDEEKPCLIPFWMMNAKKQGWEKYLNIIQKTTNRTLALINHCPKYYEDLINYIIDEVPNHLDIALTYHPAVDYVV